MDLLEQYEKDRSAIARNVLPKAGSAEYGWLIRLAMRASDRGTG